MMDKKETKGTKEEVQQGGSSTDVISLARIMRQGRLKDILLGMGVVAMIAIMSSSVWMPAVNRYYDAQDKASENSYNLQLKTFDLMEIKVLPKIDAIQVDMTSVKESIRELKDENINIKSRLFVLENLVKRLDEENGVMHKVWRNTK